MDSCIFRIAHGVDTDDFSCSQDQPYPAVVMSMEMMMERDVAAALGKQPPSSTACETTADPQPLLGFDLGCL
ncbi:MAG TPA: hypothetical protein ACQGQH_02345 [Xylella sp.]